jgi:hypothetical protein
MVNRVVSSGLTCVVFAEMVEISPSVIAGGCGVVLELSADLRPIYELELRLGNQLVGVGSPAGTACPLAIIFRDSIHFQEIGERLELPASVIRWDNTDSHYPIESGYRSSTSGHALAGPTP